MVLAFIRYKLLYHEFPFIYRSSNPYHRLVIGFFVFHAGSLIHVLIVIAVIAIILRPYPRQRPYLKTIAPALYSIFCGHFYKK
jgi:hypothetical protein